MQALGIRMAYPTTVIIDKIMVRFDHFDFNHEVKTKNPANVLGWEKVPYTLRSTILPSGIEENRLKKARPFSGKGMIAIW